MTIGEAPLRVTTLELFFDLVFAFTLTQLTAGLAEDLSGVRAVQVLLVFGVLWWMYGGYAWLANTRSPQNAAERLSLLFGMAGFLVVGLAIPRGFGGPGAPAGPSLGLGYLVVVLVHAFLYYRLNRNILHVAPFNVASALLVIAAGMAGGVAAYVLWAAALAVQAFSPLVAHPSGRFEIRPSHFVERHGALVIIALGESIAAIGIGASPVIGSFQAAASAVLGLALSASLWWLYFGRGDDAKAERVMTEADAVRRPALALSAYFYAYIPMLLGIIVLAAGLKLTIGEAARPHPAGQALAVSGGAALYVAGTAWFRRALSIGPAAGRLALAAFALAASAVGALAAIEAQLALILAAVVVTLLIEGRREPDRRRGKR